MFEKLKEILRKSKEDNCDLSIAHAKVRNDDRLAGVTDNSLLDKAYKVISDYEALVTKLWREGQLEALEELCKLCEAENSAGIREFVGKWQ